MKRIIDAVYPYFERTIFGTLIFIMMAVILLATAKYAYDIYLSILSYFHPDTSINYLQRVMHEVFGGFLIIVLGVELIGSIRTYFQDHLIKTDVVFQVAIIAVSRHVIQMDFDKANPLTLLGLGFLALTLTVGYFVYRRIGPKPVNPEAAHRGGEVCIASGFFAATGGFLGYVAATGPPFPRARSRPKRAGTRC